MFLATLDAVIGGVIWEGVDLLTVSLEVSLSVLPRKEGDVLVILFMSFASCGDLCEL